MDDNQNNVERYAYCLCLHVKPATIFVALVNLGGSLICAILAIIALSWSNDLGDIQLGSNLTDAQRSAATTLAIVIYMMLATVSAMLLYGVLKSRPSYILPFFGIQFIDFLFTLPQYLANFYYHSLSNHFTKETHHSTYGGDIGQFSHAGFFDMKHLWPSSPNNHQYQGLNLMIHTLIVIFKCYFLCVVWKCYKYLRMKEIMLPLQLPYHSSNVNDFFGAAIMVPPPNLAPPCYEETIKQNNCAPPDYESATKSDEFKFVPVTPPSTNQNQNQNQNSSPNINSNEGPESRGTNQSQQQPQSHIPC